MTKRLAIFVGLGYALFLALVVVLSVIVATVVIERQVILNREYGQETRALICQIAQSNRFVLPVGDCLGEQ